MENKTREDVFKQRQAEMSDDELIKLCQSELIKLCKSGGKSLRMCIPPMITDTDMLFQELIDRFVDKTN
jgi:hypothetical protein